MTYKDDLTPGMTYDKLLQEFEEQKASGKYKGGPLIASDGQHYNVIPPSDNEFAFGDNAGYQFSRGTNNGNNDVTYTKGSPTGYVYKDDDSFAGFLGNAIKHVALPLAGAYGLSNIAGLGSSVGASGGMTQAEMMASMGDFGMPLSEVFPVADLGAGITTSTLPELGTNSFFPGIESLGTPGLTPEITTAGLDGLGTAAGGTGMSGAFPTAMTAAEEAAALAGTGAGGAQGSLIAQVGGYGTALGNKLGSLGINTLSDLSTYLAKEGGSSVASSLIKDLVGAGVTSIGQNQVDKSIGEDIDDMFKRLQGMGLFSPEDRQGMADSAKQMMTSDVLGPRLDGLMAEYGQKPYQDLIDTSSRGLQQLYTDPMNNPIMQATANLTSENAMRRSAAGRGMNAGSMPDELQQALLAGLGGQFSNLANPMNTSFNYATDAQNNARKLPLDAIYQLNNINNTNSTRGTALANAYNAPMNAASNIANTALQARFATDPTRAIVANSGTSGSAVNRVIDKGVDKVWDWITG